MVKPRKTTKRGRFVSSRAQRLYRWWTVVDAVTPRLPLYAQYYWVHTKHVDRAFTSTKPTSGDSSKHESFVTACCV